MKPLTNHAFARVRHILALLWELQGLGARNAGEVVMPTIALVDDDRNILTSVGWNTVDVLDLTFDVVAFWSFRYHRKKPTEADILAGAVFLLTRAQ